MFAKAENNYSVIGVKEENMCASLETGMYTAKVRATMKGIDYSVTPMNRYDNTKVIKAGIFAEAYDYASEFFDPTKLRLRNEMGMMEKMNLLFRGDPGTGKTHLACTMAAEFVKKNNGIGIVLDDFEHVDFDTFVENLRINDDPNRLIIFILDEMEKNERYVLRRSKFLGFLDGALSKSNVFVFSTVNDVDDLPDYLTNRPGRFEKIYNFEFKDKEVLRTISRGLLPEEHKDNEEVLGPVVDIAFEREYGTIDHLRFFILDYLYRKEKGLSVPTPGETEEVEEEGEEKVVGELNVPMEDFDAGEIKYEEIAEKIEAQLKKMQKSGEFAFDMSNN